ncbi:MAG: ArnT family glycosyltransferase [Bacteroidales bacterium]
MKKNLWVIFILAIISFCLVNAIVEICIYPPWQDDVSYADITHSVIANNTLRLNLFFSPVKAFIWGPVYFYSQKIILSILGFGMWQFRILNLISGIYLLFIFWLIAKKLKFSNLNTLIYIALIGFDIRYVFDLSSGRMDMYALALFMSAWLLFQNKLNKKYFIFIIAGVLAALSFLTSPRIGFYFLIFILTFVVELIKTENRTKTFLQYFIFGLSILLPVLVWVYATYGSIFGYVNFYIDSPLVAKHYGGSFFPMEYQIPSILLWLLSAVYVLKTKENRFNPILLAFYALPVFHLLFIKEMGPYSAMLMPFIYLGIVYAVNSIPRKELSILPGVIALFMLFYSFSSTFTSVYLEFEHPDSFSSFFNSQQIKKNNVLADYYYYYAITENQNRYISYNDNKADLSIQHLNNSAIEYAVISKDNYIKNSKIFKDLGFVVLTEYQSKREINFFYKFAIFLKKNFSKKAIRNGYDGFVLKRNIVLTH